MPSVAEWARPDESWSADSRPGSGGGAVVPVDPFRGTMSRELESIRSIRGVSRSTLHTRHARHGDDRLNGQSGSVGWPCQAWQTGDPGGSGPPGHLLSSLMTTQFRGPSFATRARQPYPSGDG